MSSYMDADAAFAAHDAEQERKWNSRPKCAKCGQVIPDEYGMRYKGKLYCRECFDWYVMDEIIEELKEPIEGE